MKIIFLCFAVLLICSCKKSEKKSFALNEPSIPIKELKEKVIKKGDVSAYDELSTAYLNYEIPELLPYAMIMANKYNHPQAYYDVYECLVLMQCTGQDNLDCLDTASLNLALKYLKISSEKGLNLAKKTLGQYYLEGKYIPKDTVKGKQLLKDAEQK